MRKLCTIVLLAAATVFAQVSAEAVTVFKATLTGDQETPPLPNEGSGGVATFILNDARTALSYDVQLFGLDLDGLQTPGIATDNVTRVHFHRAPVAIAGPIVFGIIDTDANADLRNDNNPNDLVVDPVHGHITGVWNLNEGSPRVPTTLANELDNLFAGQLYFNVHTSDHPGGEIRGQVHTVPEPATLVLVVTGLVGILGTAALRRHP